MLATLMQIDGWDPVAGAAVTLRAASHDDPRLCHVNGQTWWPALAKLPKLRYDLFDGAFAGAISAPSSSLTLSAEPWPQLGRYILADAAIKLWTGELGDAWSGFTLRFDGRVSAQPQIADMRAEVDFAVDDSWLDAALLQTYAGTTGAEGMASLKGQPKPLALGTPRYVPGTLIDSVNSVFQVSSYGAIHGFEAALEKLARFGSPVGDFADYAALVAANVPAGRWATAKAVGMARLGAPPTGQVSFLIGGDAAGPNGWASTPGQLIRRLALLSGGAGRIDDASLDALDAASPYDVSLYLDQQGTARDLIQKIAASVNAVANVSWTGKLFVVPVALGTPSVTLAADGSSLPPVSGVKQIDIAAPWQKLAIGAERAWTVHALADIAFTAPLLDLGRYNNATVYREGNIVDLANGSRWLFTATTPSAGHVPEVGAYWTNLSPATSAADITYEDGTPLEDLKPAEPGATNGAPPTSPVGDRTAQEVVDGLDVNVNAILEQALRQDDLLQVFDVRTLVEGQPVGTSFLTFRNDQTTANSAVNSSLTLLGAKNSSGTAFDLNLDTVNVSPTQTLAQHLSEISTAAGDASASVTALQEAIVDGTGGYARASQLVAADGSVAGYSSLAGGGTSAFTVVGQKIYLATDASGANLASLISFTGGKWVFGTNLYVQRVSAGAVITESLADAAVQKTRFKLVTSDVSIARGVVGEVVSLDFVKDEDDSTLKLQFFGMFWSADDLQFAGSFVLDGGTSFSAGTVNIVLDTTSSQGKMPMTPFLYLEGLAAGSHTVAFNVLNAEVDDIALTVKAGSALEVVELKQGAV